MCLRGMLLTLLRSALSPATFHDRTLKEGPACGSGRIP